MSSPAGYKLRKFHESDLEKVVAINRTCLPENYTSTFFLDLHHSSPEAFFVAEYNGEVVGYVACRIELGFSEFKRFKISRKGHLVSIAVMPEHRRKGVASELMLNALKGMTRHGCSETYLEVRKGNIEAINLYKKFGYKSVQVISSYYYDGEDALSMSRLFPFKPESEHSEK